MKIIAMFLLVIATSLAANAKDYIPIIPNDTSFFTGSNGQILAVRVDSIKTNDNDTYYFLNRTWDTEDLSCIKPTGPSWLGQHVIEESDSVYLFFNNNNDTISIKPLTPANSSFRLYNYPNGDYIQVTVSSITYEEFLGLSDSVKHFTLEHFNRKGQIIADNITDKIFSVSKNYGFVKVFNIVEFPEIFSEFALSGKTNPQAGKTFLTPNEIFDFELGDEFHYSEYYSGYQENWTEKTIRKVLEKYYSEAKDSIIYKIHRIISYDGTIWDSSGSHERKWSLDDTTIEKHKIYKIKYLPLEPMINKEDYYYDICSESLPYLYIQKSEIHNRRIFKPTIGLLMNSYSDSCWNIIIDAWGPGDFLEGCGFFYSWDGMHGDVFQHSKSLVYYKKEEEIWGEPLVISVEENKSFGSFNYFPNPVKRDEIITIRNQTPISKVKIIDILGNERISLTAGYQNEIKLKLNNLESGLYCILFYYLIPEIILFQTS